MDARTKRLELPRDDEGRVVGFQLGRDAAMLDHELRREAAEVGQLGHKYPRPTGIDWDAQPLGQLPDYELADRLRVCPSHVITARLRRGIPNFTGRVHRHWTQAEDATVRRHYRRHGKSQLAALAKRLDRTPAACSQRMNRLGCGRKRLRELTQWPKTLKELADEWGYSRRRITIAAHRLGIQFARGPKRSYRAILVTREQAMEVRQELSRHPDGIRLHARQSGEWSPGTACAWCRRRDRRRSARELCSACYQRVRKQERKVR